MEKAQAPPKDETFCKLCSKHFTTANSFANHKQSKKHKDLEATVLGAQKTVAVVQLETQPTQEDATVEEVAAVVPNEVDSLITCKSDRAAKKSIQREEYLKKQAETAADEADMEVEEVDEADWEDIADDSDLLG